MKNSGTRHWLAVVAAVAATLALGEIVARAYSRGGELDPPIYAPSGSGYALTPVFKGTLWTGIRAAQITIDSTGHRNSGCADLPAPSAGATPVHVVGDSQVFGWGLSDCETIPSQLQRRLGPAFRVHNHGVPGYGPYQYERVIASLPKDQQVIVAFTAQNDLWDLYQQTPLTPVICGRLLSPDSWFSALPCLLLSSQNLQWATHQLKDTGHASLPIQRDQYARASRAVLESRLNAVYERLSARGHVRFTFIPWELDSDAARRKKYPAAEGQVLDAREPFRDDCGARAILAARPDSFLANDTHLSPAGAAALADCMSRLVSPRPSLDRSPPSDMTGRAGRGWAGWAMLVSVAGRPGVTGRRAGVATPPWLGLAAGSVRCACRTDAAG